MIKELNELCNQGLLIKQKHNIKPLIIWNYSRKVTYEKLWNINPLLLQCRGIVTDSEGKIVSRCIPKFFNYEELTIEDIPNEPFEMTEKMDGQFGNLFYYKNEWIITSRGSFESIYAVKAKELLQKYDYQKLDTDYTYLFEIIFKEGRIVCKYDFEDLIMLVRIHIESGIEETIYNQGFEDLGFILVKKYDGINDFKQIKLLIGDDNEGFVIRFKSGFRMKIKGNEYCRLHSILTKFSTRDIWRHLKEGLSLEELLIDVPDEFDNWVRDKVMTYTEMFRITKQRILMMYYYEINTDGDLTQKDIALKILTKDKTLQSILFNIHNQKNYENLIWDRIYPEYSKPFTNNNNEDDEI